MNQTDANGYTAQDLADMNGGSASDYQGAMVYNVDSSGVASLITPDATATTPSTGSGSIFGSALSAIPSLLSSGITAYTAVNNQSNLTAAQALAAKNAAAANAAKLAGAQSSLNLSSALPYVLGLLGFVALLLMLRPKKS